MLKEPVRNSAHQASQAGNGHNQGAMVFSALAGLFGFEENNRRASLNGLIDIKSAGVRAPDRAINASPEATSRLSVFRP